MEVGGTGPATRIEDDFFQLIAVGAGCSGVGRNDHLSALRDVMLVLECEGINSGSVGVRVIPR